jgi:pilus assembly protein CpaB
VAGATDPDQIVRPSAAERAQKLELDGKTVADVQGAAVRSQIPQGSPILRSALVKPGDRAFLHMVLGPGARAISIPLPAGIGILNPGDHVDVILTQTFKGEAPLTRRSVSETVADDLRVLAIDPVASASRSLTLEVTPEQAEHINVAGELGKLSLTLRGGERATDVATRPVRPTWAGDVSPALTGAAAPAATPKPPTLASPSIDVIRGNHSEKIKSE